MTVEPDVEILRNVRALGDLLEALVLLASRYFVASSSEVTKDLKLKRKDSLSSSLAISCDI